MKAPDEVNFQVLCLYAKVFARSGKEVHVRFLQRLESAALPSGHEAL